MKRDIAEAEKEIKKRVKAEKSEVVRNDADASDYSSDWGEQYQRKQEIKLPKIKMRLANDPILKRLNALLTQILSEIIKINTDLKKQFSLIKNPN